MKLGTLLLRNAAIGLSQLEGALRNQVLYGGRLGTNLVELGFIDLELLSTYLAELTGYPLASPRQLDEADLDLLDKLGSDDAHRLRAIPLGDLGNTQSLAVAMVDPTDAVAIGELAAKLGSKITPYVVPELRALYYLEKLFGQPRRARFVRSGTAPSDGETEPVDDRRRSQPAKGMVLPPAFTLEPRRRRTSSQMTLSSAGAPAITYGAACERIDTATQREQIADAMVEYAKGRCDLLILFLIRDGNALGWRGYVAPPVRKRSQIEELSLPLGGASSLQSAHDAGELFLGAPPSAAKPVETQLWTALAVSPEPTHVLVVPILVKTRAVNLIYVHTPAGPPADAFVTELRDLAHLIQASYLRLIKQARGS
ncbi:MAG: hypothetical protein H0T42_07285 [Deltaproteobacteria bacterium]|nr:hypothetical protein [Deltaproteobacteria bacterium]